MILNRPRMITVMRLAIYRTASVYILPTGKSPLAVSIKHFHDFLVVRLIICYEYCFHTIKFLCLKCGSFRSFLGKFLLLALFLSGCEYAIDCRNKYKCYNC